MGSKRSTAYMSRYMVSAAFDTWKIRDLADTGFPGSAPDISGKGIVNPVAAILSVAMLLQFSLNLPIEAKAVEDAVRRTIDKGVRTGDIGGSASTSEVGDAVAEELKKVLSSSAK